MKIVSLSFLPISIEMAFANCLRSQQVIEQNDAN